MKPSTKCWGTVFKELSVPDGTDLFFSFISQHFVLGYFRRVPAGLIFSNHQRACAIPIASPLC